MDGSRKYTGGHILLALVSGALAGSGMALLLAPQSGRKTRAQLAGYLVSAREKWARVIEALRGTALAPNGAVAAEAANRALSDSNGHA